MTARQIIQKEFNGANNFMTPDVLGYERIGKNIAVELSKGRGFQHEPIYGVTFVVVKPDGSTRRGRKSSQCFHSRGRAMSHIDRVKALLESMA
jgi:hypothetical protein